MRIGDFARRKHYTEHRYQLRDLLYKLLKHRKLRRKSLKTAISDKGKTSIMKMFKLTYGIKGYGPTYSATYKCRDAYEATIEARKRAIAYHKECENTSMKIANQGDKNYYEALELEIFYRVDVLSPEGLVD